MIKEEIIKGLHFTVGTFLVDPLTGEERDEESLNNLDKTAVNACRGAVKILEQEPVLDKIRTEIKSLERFEIRGEATPLVNVDRVLKIIDKAENEDKE